MYVLLSILLCDGEKLEFFACSRNTTEAEWFETRIPRGSESLLILIGYEIVFSQNLIMICLNLHSALIVIAL